MLGVVPACDRPGRASPPGSTPGPPARAEDDSSERRLGRSANALALNTAVTGGLGVAFWVVAARLLPTETVGRDGALINLAMTIAITLSTALAITIAVLMPRARNAGSLLL